MLTEVAAATWRRGLRGFDPAGGDPLAPRVRELVHDPDHVTGTVNVLARDAAGHLASATSTSGWAWKYPGRAGDTGIIGAGNYCDDRFGAATCTGWGELAMRSGTARVVVAAMQHGVDPGTACRDALTDLPEAGVAAETPLHVLALATGGSHAAFSTRATARYAYWDDTLPAAERRERLQA